MTHHYLNLGSASDWLNQISQVARPIRSTTQIWVMTRHQYGISVLASQMSFGVETSGSVTKCWLFSQATIKQNMTFSLKGRQNAQVIQMSNETKVLYRILNCAALTSRKIVFFFPKNIPSYYHNRISYNSRALYFRAGGCGFNCQGGTNTQGLKMKVRTL